MKELWVLMKNTSTVDAFFFIKKLPQFNVHSVSKSSPFSEHPTFTKTNRVDCRISEANIWFKSQATRGDTQAMEWFSFFVRHSLKGTSGTIKRLWLFDVCSPFEIDNFLKLLWEYVEKWKAKLVTRIRFHIHQEKVPNEIKEFSPLPTNLHHLLCYYGLELKKSLQSNKTHDVWQQRSGCWSIQK